MSASTTDHSPNRGTTQYGDPWGLDEFGMRYAVTDVGGRPWPYYITACCDAAVSIDWQGTTYCKACYEPADPMMGGIPSGDGVPSID